MEGGALVRSCGIAIRTARPPPSLFLLVLHPSVFLASSCSTRRLSFSASPFPSSSPSSCSRKFFPLLDCLKSDCLVVSPSKRASCRLHELVVSSGRESSLPSISARERSAKETSVVEQSFTQETGVGLHLDKAPLGSQKVSRTRRQRRTELKDIDISRREKSLKRESDSTGITVGPLETSRSKKTDEKLSENASANANTDSQGLRKVSSRRKKDVEINEAVSAQSCGLHNLSKRKQINRATVPFDVDLLSVEKPLVRSDNLSVQQSQSFELQNKPDSGLEPRLSLADNTSLRVKVSQKTSRSSKRHSETKETGVATVGANVLRVDKPLVRRKKIPVEPKETASGAPDTDPLHAAKSPQSSDKNIATYSERGPSLRKAARGKKRHSEDPKISSGTDFELAEKARVDGEEVVGRNMQEKNTCLNSKEMLAGVEASSEPEQMVIASETSFAAPNVTGLEVTQSVTISSSQPSHFSAIEKKKKTPTTTEVAVSPFQKESQGTVLNVPLAKESSLTPEIEIQEPAKLTSTSSPEHASRSSSKTMEQSSFEKVRAVDNSVEQTSLMDCLPTSLSGDRVKSQDCPPHVKGMKRPFPVVDKDDSFQKPRRLEIMSKPDSKSIGKLVKKEPVMLNSGSTRRTDSPSSLDDLDSYVDQVVEKNRREAVSLQVPGFRKRNFVKAAEQKASLSFAEVYSSMSILDSNPKSTQPHNPTTEEKFLANKERSEGKKRTAPKKFSIRNVKANQASTISYVQILGTGFDTGDTVPTVLLFFDRRRFIFNAGEGLYRFCVEHKIKLSKIDHIFLTRVCSETTGGLPGFFLTLAGLGETGMTAQVWGPSALQDLVNAMRNFVPSASMLHTHSFGNKEDQDSAALLGLSQPILLVEDELVKISAVLLRPLPYSRESLEKQKDVSCDGQIFQRWTDSHTKRAPFQEEKTQNCVSVAYICELSEVAGKFDPVRAQAKGLKPGPKYGILQRGESVLSDDGLNMVHPEDVLGPSSRGPVMILVDCPSSSHIPALMSASTLQSFFSGAGKVVDCMVHITPISVTKSKEYQDWMRKFGEAQHIIAGQQMEGLGIPILRSSAKILSKLNLICPQVFPIVGPSRLNQEKIADDKEDQVDRTLTAENLLKFHLRPISASGPDRSDVPETFEFIAIQNKLMKEHSEILEARDYVSKFWKAQDTCGNAGSGDGWDQQNVPECLQHVTREEMEVVFLGTGSSQPSAYRNVSAVYLNLFKHGGVLLDCGEGTYAQLKRRYGAKEADDVLMGLKCIWISHMHADHHTGLPRILSVRRQLLEKKSMRKHILVIGPGQLKRFLQAYEKVEDLDMDFLDCNQTTAEGKDLFTKRASAEQTDEHTYNVRASSSLNIRGRGLIHLPEEAGSSGPRKGQMQNLRRQQGMFFHQELDVAGRGKLQSVLDSLGLKDLVSVPVVHCLSAYGVVLEAQGKQLHGGKIQPGWKLVYSGDTRPCQQLIDAAHGATLLIHEATFDDSMVMEAIMKNHSLTKEAIGVGVSAGVYRIFLTHFSQRYPKIPIFDESYTDRTCIAFDMMSVNLADLPLFPKLLPPLKLLFNDELMTEDDVEHDLM